MERSYRIAVAGIGYVGLANAILLAQHNTVTAVDVLVFHRALTRREKLGLALSAVCLVLVNL